MERDNAAHERRILVADSDPDSRLVVASVVSILGHEPVVAQGALEALDECGRSLPDLVILDYMLPSLTGIEVCQRLRSLKGGELVPVLMVTARDEMKDKISALEEGIDDYITKPFDYQELQARIKALLRVRDLSVRLVSKNDELKRMQELLVETEKQVAVGQLAGTAAHQLGQPLSAIMLNCFLLDRLPKDDPKFAGALAAIQSDVRRMVAMIDSLRNVKASAREGYFGNTEILKLGDDE
jgi:two-component system NtrC family sensor kinase